MALPRQSRTILVDYKVSAVIDKNQNMLVPFYLMCSYAYYKLDTPIISDHLFDDMSKRLLENYDEIEHWHKHLITRGDLEAGTYLGEYPERVINGLSHFIRS